MSMPQLREQFPDRYLSWPRQDVDCSEDIPLTSQADSKELDINRIVARVMKGQSVPVLMGEPFYGDVSEISDLQDAIIKVQESNALFMSYPAELRERFDNDPVKFVEFFNDEKNIPEAIKLGLALKSPVEQEEVIPPAEPPAKQG